VSINKLNVGIPSDKSEIKALFEIEKLIDFKEFILCHQLRNNHYY